MTTTSVTPELPTETDNPNKFLDDPGYTISQKIDGHRAVLFVDGSVTAYNRHGAIRSIPHSLSASLTNVKGRWELDGELIGKQFYVFDLRGGQIDMHAAPWSVRYAALQRLFEAEVFPPDVRLLPAVTDDKRAFFSTVESSGGEGVVFKRLDAVPSNGRSRNWWKYKFTKTVDCVVTAVKTDGRNNLTLAVYRGDELVEVGRVSALTGDGPKVKVGDVVEVTCLYSTNSDKGRRLYQPTRPILRTDKLPHECVFSQLEAVATNPTIITTVPGN